MTQNDLNDKLALLKTELEKKEHIIDDHKADLVSFPALQIAKSQTKYMSEWSAR